MPDIDFDEPLVFRSHSDRTEELLYCYYGVDDWECPTAFTVRLQRAVHRNEDGKIALEDVARFDHNGHSAFEWNPSAGDGFHIDVYPHGEKEKYWLATPPRGVDYDALTERFPPSERIYATMEYCRSIFEDESNRAYLLEVSMGRVSQFDPREIGLTPESSSTANRTFT